MTTAALVGANRIIGAEAGHAASSAHAPAAPDEAGRPAARVGDPCGAHSKAGLGAFLGGLAGFAIGAIGVALAAGAIVLTAGLAAPIVAGAYIGLAAAGVGLVASTASGVGTGARVGQTFKGSPCGDITTGSPNVIIENKKAARAELDIGRHGSSPKIETGAATVHINGKPAGREGEKISCGGILIDKCAARTWIGGKSTSSGAGIDSVISWADSIAKWAGYGALTLAGIAVLAPLAAGVAGLAAFGTGAAALVGGYKLGQLGGHAGEKLGSFFDDSTTGGRWGMVGEFVGSNAAGMVNPLKAGAFAGKTVTGGRAFGNTRASEMLPSMHDAKLGTKYLKGPKDSTALGTSIRSDLGLLKAGKVREGHERAKQNRAESEAIAARQARGGEQPEPTRRDGEAESPPPTCTTCSKKKGSGRERVKEAVERVRGMDKRAKRTQRANGAPARGTPDHLKPSKVAVLETADGHVLTGFNQKQGVYGRNGGKNPPPGEIGEIRNGTFRDLDPRVATEMKKVNEELTVERDALKAKEVTEGLSVPERQRLADVERGLEHDGRCAEPQALSRTVQSGHDPEGATMYVAKTDKNATPAPPCAHCQKLLERFGVNREPEMTVPSPPEAPAVPTNGHMVGDVDTSPAAVQRALQSLDDKGFKFSQDHIYDEGQAGKLGIREKVAALQDPNGPGDKVHLPEVYKNNPNIIQDGHHDLVALELAGKLDPDLVQEIRTPSTEPGVAKVYDNTRPATRPSEVAMHNADGQLIMEPGGRVLDTPADRIPVYHPERAHVNPDGVGISDGGRAVMQLDPNTMVYRYEPRDASMPMSAHDSPYDRGAMHSAQHDYVYVSDAENLPTLERLRTEQGYFQDNDVVLRSERLGDLLERHGPDARVLSDVTFQTSVVGAGGKGNSFAVVVPKRSNQARTNPTRGRTEELSGQRTTSQSGQDRRVGENESTSAAAAKEKQGCPSCEGASSTPSANETAGAAGAKLSEKAPTAAETPKRDKSQKLKGIDDKELSAKGGSGYVSPKAAVETVKNAWQKTERFDRMHPKPDGTPRTQEEMTQIFDGFMSHNLTEFGPARVGRNDGNRLFVIDDPFLATAPVPNYIKQRVTIDHHDMLFMTANGAVDTSGQQIIARAQSQDPRLLSGDGRIHWSSGNVNDGLADAAVLLKNADRLAANPEQAKTAHEVSDWVDNKNFMKVPLLDAPIEPGSSTERALAVMRVDDQLTKATGTRVADRMAVPGPNASVIEFVPADRVRSHLDEAHGKIERVLFDESPEARAETSRLAQEQLDAIRSARQQVADGTVDLGNYGSEPSGVLFFDSTNMAKSGVTPLAGWRAVPEQSRVIEAQRAANGENSPIVRTVNYNEGKPDAIGETSGYFIGTSGDVGSLDQVRGALIKEEILARRKLLDKPEITSSPEKTAQLTKEIQALEMGDGVVKAKLPGLVFASAGSRLSKADLVAFMKRPDIRAMMEGRPPPEPRSGGGGQPWQGPPEAPKGASGGCPSCSNSGGVAAAPFTRVGDGEQAWVREYPGKGDESPTMVKRMKRVQLPSDAKADMQRVEELWSGSGTDARTKAIVKEQQENILEAHTLSREELGAMGEVLTTKHNLVADAFPEGVVPRLSQATDGEGRVRPGILLQSKAEGLKFDDLSPAAQARATDEMDRMRAVAQAKLGIPEGQATEGDHTIAVDMKRDPDAFFFHSDGSVKHWVDPVWVTPTKVNMFAGMFL
jgi:uncharacterized Zn-binding protein involved in type VI secretion